MEKTLLATCRKLRKYQCFCSLLSKKHCKYRGFCWQKKQHHKYRGFGLPRRNKYWYLRCSLLQESQTDAKTQPIWRFSATTRQKKTAGVTTTTTPTPTPATTTTTPATPPPTTTTVTVPWFLAWEAPKTSKFVVFFVAKASQHDPLWSATQRQQKFELDSFVSLFFSIFLWWRILHRYASTNRRRYAQKPLYTQSSFYAQILLHREVCAKINFYTQTPLHTEVFTQKSFEHRSFYTPMLCTKMHLHA